MTGTHETAEEPPTSGFSDSSKSDSSSPDKPCRRRDARRASLFSLNCREGRDREQNRTSASTRTERGRRSRRNSPLLLSLFLLRRSSYFLLLLLLLLIPSLCLDLPYPSIQYLLPDSIVLCIPSSRSRMLSLRFKQRDEQASTNRQLRASSFLFSNQS